LIKRLLKNKKGTAEVIGSVMFIVILLFFFTNVYLWHDAATKEMNDLYVQKLNSPIAITVSHIQNNQYDINIANNGGVDATISMLWINEKNSTLSGPDIYHLNSTTLDKVVVEAGGFTLRSIFYNPIREGDPLLFKVITTTGNSASYALR
jgi:hypothetical protein